MTVLSAQAIRNAGILEPFSDRCEDKLGLTRGLGPAGYDLSLVLPNNNKWQILEPGEFLLASSRERFTMPIDLIGIVHDKSSLARRGLSVFNTVIEPGWRGWLTLELVNHGAEHIMLVRNQGVAQVIFHRLDRPTDQPYDGKYQDQEWGPQGAR